MILEEEEGVRINITRFQIFSCLKSDGISMATWPIVRLVEMNFVLAVLIQGLEMRCIAINMNLTRSAFLPR